MQPVNLSMQSLETFLNQLASFLPTLFGSLGLLLVGWLLARLIRKGIVTLLKLIHFQNLAERSGVEAFLKQGGINLSLTSVIAGLVYWLTILITLAVVANNLGLGVVANLFNQAVLYLPHVIAAIFVLVIGILAARLVNRTLFAFLNNMRFSGALNLSTIAEYAVTIFAVFMALEQLQISTVLLYSAFQISFGALALAFALAFGLGGREWAAGILKQFSDRDR